MKKIVIILSILFAFAFGSLAGIGFSKAELVRSTQEHNVMSTNWFQSSAENKALQIQIYNQAKEELAETMIKKKASDKLNKNAKPAAVVLDIDETILDNSPDTAWSIKNNTSYPQGWDEWIHMAKAELIPGAKDFLLAAKKMNVDVFYLTNRPEKTRDDTIKNLNLHGLPNVDSKHLFLKTNTAQKGPRQAEIAKTHEIVMLVGDNTNDLSDIFYKADLKTRKDNVDKIAKDLGIKYIQLPNPMYGDWEDAIYHYKMSKTADEKAVDRYKALQPMK
ncbi:5'-nucleotidase, lipoprotein e(P4) family [Bacillus sp. AFS029533]|uniref:5'-nucleotidase, lipoprotein e(P4) family n=1 Tax=Bacillus sp. AFS029533 TaxID=2033494 RepID=UPI000BFD1855|nr:5'-nucleotidase, lipoprotein e(P4) family [Bacillus sp. AFS029533]PGZ88244.1 5'-nucleotidase, lipoprotein e(P4) family [Bacillus sp. AFS029533]